MLWRFRERISLFARMWLSVTTLFLACSSVVMVGFNEYSLGYIVGVQGRKGVGYGGN